MSDYTNGDHTKSNYNKTGKKVKCISSGRTDLIYKKVYDVFIDNKGKEFVIDEAGDRCYESMEFPLWCGVFDDANIENKTTKSESVVVRKFKVGDTVKVVDTEQISQWTKDIEVGYVGVVVDVNVNVEDTPYKVRLDKCYCDWWFTDKCIELVRDDTNIIENESSPIKSDGGSSSYYAQQIPKGMLERFNTTGTIEAKDVIRLFLGNDFNMGNIFKAYCRITSLRQGKGKAGIDEQYDLTKAKFFTEDELNYYLENKDV